METVSSYVLIHGKNISHDGPSDPAASPHMSIDKLFPALLECFGIILCGYVAGRCLCPAHPCSRLLCFPFVSMLHMCLL